MDTRVHLQSRGLSGMGKPQRRDAAARRLAILAAAEIVFAEKGLDVPLEEICSAAGVGRATLYRNFENRIDLVRAIMSNNLDKLEAIVVGEGDPRQCLVAYLSEVLDQLVTTGGLVYLIQNDRSYSDRYRDQLARLIAAGPIEGCRPDLDVHLTDLIVEMMSGALTNRSLAQRREVAPTVLDLALRALG